AEKGPYQCDSHQKKDKATASGIGKHRQAARFGSFAGKQTRQQRLEQMKDENDRHAQAHDGPVGREYCLSSLASDLQTKNRCDDYTRHKGGNDGVAKWRFHQTFSTSGLPSSPVGLNSRIRT